jgi:hypothetical protein
MSSENKYSKEYWDGHSITDGCEPLGFMIASWRLINYPEQAEAAKKFKLGQPPSGNLITSGRVNPADLPLGTILMFEEEALSAGRVNNSAEKLLAVATLGFVNTKLPWAPPRYDHDWSIGVVADIERFREDPIRGLVTFDDKSVVQAISNDRYNLLIPHPISEVLDIGQVKHLKLMEKLQANDHQVIKRITQVEIF